MIDQRTMDKYEKEAKEQSRDSWYLSWALDTNKEERAKVFFFTQHNNSL
jgi:peptide chain release factor subunit 3